MDNITGIINDVIVIFFDLLIYTRLTALRKDTRGTKIAIAAGCALIFAAYIVSTYVFGMAASVSSFVCMTLPSFVFFWILSKYRDARFIVTFCFVDTVTLIIAFFARIAGIYGGELGGVLSCVVTAVLMGAIYLCGRRYFSRYRKLLEYVRDGWKTMMISTLLIYFLLIFAAAYPEPLLQRLEYMPVYGCMSVVMLSFYAVFIMQLFQKRRLYDLNMQLQEEMKWHRIAYIDGLTQKQNRMAYMERINELERTWDAANDVHALIVDIDDFKYVNDTFGHHVGDEMLVKVAAFLEQAFCDEGCELFRIGGDEFAILVTAMSADRLAEKLAVVNNVPAEAGLGCTLSCGHAAAVPGQNNSIENAYIAADRAMYEIKNAKKLAR